MLNLAITLFIFSMLLTIGSFIFMRNKDYKYDESENLKAARLGGNLDKQLTKAGYKLYTFGIFLIMISFILIAIWAISRFL